MTWDDGDPVSDLESAISDLKKSIGTVREEATYVTPLQWQKMRNETCPCGCKWEPCIHGILACETKRHLMFSHGRILDLSTERA